MKYRLQDLIDMEHFQNLQDRLNEIYSFPSAIIDNNGKILTATAWQDICSQFHRKNKESEAHCIESDQYIRDHLHEANPAVSYRCPHGLVDNATPIIIDGIHYGNFFTGQFFLEEPDINFFKAQAKKYEFDEDAYLDAVRRVPIWTQDQLDSYLFFIKGLIAVIAESGLKKLEEIETRERIEKSEGRHRSIIQAAMDGFWLTDIKGRLIEVNNAYCGMSGYNKEELLSMGISDLEATENQRMIAEHMQKVIAQGSDRFESKHRRKDGTVFNVEVSIQFRPDEGGRCVCFLRDITERKIAQEALLESERKWRNILVNTPQIGISLDQRARIVFANENFLKLTGWEAQAVIGEDWFSMFIPENVREGVRNVFYKVICQKDTLGFSNYENEILTKSGELRNIAWSNVITKDIEGNVFDVTCLGVDLTERQRSEKALGKREAYMRSIFRAAPTGIGVVQDRIFSQVNEKFCEMVGYSVGELLGQHSRIVYPNDEEFERVGREKYTQISQTGTGTVETLLKRKDGKVIHVLLSSTPIDIKNIEAGITFTALDITNRKRSEQALRISHERFLTVLNSLDATIFVADMETYEILFMNKFMIEVFGKDMTGEKCWKSFRGESGPCQYCPKDQLVDENGKPTDVYIWQDTNPLTGKEYNNYDRAIEWYDGRLVKIQIATDITKIKGMEKRIREAQKMESIGNLAGGIAHDFNNILFPIIGLSEILMDDLPEGSPEQNNATAIFNAGKRGSELVQQILTFSRQTEYKMLPVNIQKIIREVLKLSHATIPTYIEIIHDITNSGDLVMANPAQIHQVVMNLVTNAYHAIGQNPGKILVGLNLVELAEENFPESVLSSGKYAKLTVSDTGTGIDPAIMDKIFNPYFTTKEQGKGTGLGLAMVYGIVNEHHGDIRVCSELGVGTRFSVYLPLVENPDKPNTVLNVETYETGTERILLVDDEEAIANLERQMLDRLGYKVTSRVSCIEALKAFEANPWGFDLVITDMAMPNMTGDQFAKELISIRSDIPIIICTGFSERINAEMAKAIGVKGFLMKPVVKSDLSEMVRHVLDEACR
jgi:PAS domain S-box-containing protein